MNGQKTKKTIHKTSENTRVLGDEISCIDGILYKNNQLILPRPIRSQILKTLHSSLRNCYV